MNTEQNKLQGKFLNACANDDLAKLKNVLSKLENMMGHGEGSLGMHGLSLAINAGALNVVKYLAEGCHIDIYEEHGKALYYAGEAGNLEIIKYLIEDCQVNLHIDEESALRWSAHKEHLDIVKYLIKQGADCGVFKDEQDWKQEYKFCLSAVQEIAMEQKEEVLLIKAQKIEKAEQRFKDNIKSLKQAGVTKKPVRRRSAFKK